MSQIDGICRESIVDHIRMFGVIKIPQKCH
jgi:hypothetical protein